MILLSIYIWLVSVNVFFFFFFWELLTLGKLFIPRPAIKMAPLRDVVLEREKNQAFS